MGARWHFQAAAIRSWNIHLRRAIVTADQAAQAAEKSEAQAMNHTRFLRKAAAIGTAAAIAASAVSVANAAPIGSGQLAIKSAASTDVIDVGWKGRRNTAIALGVLGGLALGGALAYPYYGPAYPYAYVAPPPRKCLAWDPYYGRNVWVYC
jgi:hypothetical protein